MRRGCVHPWLLATFVVGLVVSAGITAWLGEARARTEREIFDEAYAVAERRTIEIARRIDDRLRDARRVAASIADELSDGTLTPADVDARLAQVMTDDPTLFSVGVAYEPAAGLVGPGLYAPRMVRDQDIVHARQLGFDYTAFEHRWYGEPMLKGAQWNEPYLDPTEDTVVVGFGAPFRPAGSTDDARPVGLVLASYSADEIRREISEIGLGGGGYPFLISPEGRFIVHPIDDYMRAGQTVFELAWEQDDTVLHATAIRAIGGENGYVDHIDSVTGQVSRILYQRIAEAGWSLGVVFFTADLGNDDARRHRLLSRAGERYRHHLVHRRRAPGGRGARHGRGHRSLQSQPVRRGVLRAVGGAEHGGARLHPHGRVRAVDRVHLQHERGGDRVSLAAIPSRAGPGSEPGVRPPGGDRGNGQRGLQIRHG
ncbi:MAG: cache domain-containing protein [Vicinamibacterales bacterium]|jgi:hypothetical protein|nr:cache domain-containing protein [Vicinamibacterales bacterium]MDP7478946.1 cache domain-containing protein [Vicinamibacterales bacterium]MDP7690393.1 cache domain-containing protein [Vicinamibacterales bacterium]HJN44677.1 cache domain-containing protein [Vicinamibacterales bacterium]